MHHFRELSVVLVVVIVVVVVVVAVVVVSSTTMSLPDLLQLALMEEDVKLQETRQKLSVAEADLTQRQEETREAEDHHNALCAPGECSANPIILSSQDDTTDESSLEEAESSDSTLQPETSSTEGEDTDSSLSTIGIDDPNWERGLAATAPVATPRRRSSAEGEVARFFLLDDSCATEKAETSSDN